jgi:protein gp37
VAENTKIQWAHHTFNPWRGCAKVSPACDNCYAEAMAKRNPKVLGIWGEDGTRPVAGESYWQQPLKWDKEAAATGERQRVFCASLADVFEGRRELEPLRWRLGQLILKTPNLDWLLLTKRPENWRRCFDEMWGEHTNQAPPNVWMGATVENQPMLKKRLPILAEIPAKRRFLSMEPLLEKIDFAVSASVATSVFRLDWIIVGGESGHGARPFPLSFVRNLKKSLLCSGVKLFVKQLGALPIQGGHPLKLKDRSGGDMSEWPADLRIRRVPGVDA